MIFESEAIVELAKSLQASPAQAILATSMYRGIEVIPLATKLERIYLIYVLVNRMYARTRKKIVYKLVKHVKLYMKSRI